MAAEPPARSAIAEIRRRAGESGILCDFDGTLAPIVDDPAEARPLGGTVALLTDLADRYRLVGVVSGRPAAFLIERFGIAGGLSRVRVFGVYGMESVGPDGEVLLSPEARPWLDTVEEVARRAGRGAPAGVRVEPKGAAVTFHYRQAPSAEGWAREAAVEASAGTGLEVHAGKMSFELRPPVTSDKGTVVEQVSAELRGLCYMGDDLGDLPAFAALDRLGDRSVITCKVAVTGPEAPPELTGAADLAVHGPSGAVELLHRLDPGAPRASRG